MDRCVILPRMDSLTEIYTVIAVAVTIILPAVLLLASRTRAAGTRTVVLISSLLAATSGAAFFSTRLLIKMLEDLATLGGGIAATSAGMAEAWRPLEYSAMTAIVMAIVSLGVVAAGKEEEDGEPSNLPALWLVLTLVLSSAPFLLFAHLTSFILHIVDPRVHDASMSVTSASNHVATGLVALSTMSVAAVFLLIVLAIVVLARTKWGLTASTMSLLFVLTIVSLGISVAYMIPTVARLTHIAVSGTAE